MTSATAPDRRPRLLVSGSHSSPHSGAAIVHRELAQRLPALLDEAEVVDDFDVGSSLVRRLAGRRADADVWLTTSTPTPARARPQLVSIVYDVRWKWTRGPLARAYRAADLRTTARRSAAILTISNTVREQLRALRIEPPGGVHVLELGPGQMESRPAPEVGDRRPELVLIGAAEHKRNERAAALLASLPEIVQRFLVVAVSVSAEAKSTLERAWPTGSISCVENIDPPHLADVLSGARTYVSLGTSEGFGFPYLEASYMGCDVVAPDCAVTRELLGDDASYISTESPSAAELLRALDRWDVERVRRLQQRAADRSWDKAAEQAASILGPLLAHS